MTIAETSAVRPIEVLVGPSLYEAALRAFKAVRKRRSDASDSVRLGPWGEVGAAGWRERIHGGDVVVLAGMDDAVGPVAKTLKEARRPAAKYLLVGSPTTTLAAVADRVASLDVRTSQRLHVAQPRDRKEESELLQRFFAALGPSGEAEAILDARCEGDRLVVRSTKLNRIDAPQASFPALRKASHADRADFEVDVDGSYLYWPRLDVHLGWEQLRQAVEPGAKTSAIARSAEFNRRYGAAIRRFREERKLTQDLSIELSSRQLRRIEQGACRATRTALAQLAAAHGLPLADYLGELARRMEPAA